MRMVRRLQSRHRAQAVVRDGDGRLLTGSFSHTHRPMGMGDQSHLASKNELMIRAA